MPGNSFVAPISPDPESMTAAVRALAARAGMNMSQFARQLGYARAASIQYHFHPHLYRGGYLSYNLAERMLKHLVGLGDPPITKDDIRALVGPELAPYL